MCGEKEVMVMCEVMKVPLLSHSHESLCDQIISGLKMIQLGIAAKDEGHVSQSLLSESKIP